MLTYDYSSIGAHTLAWLDMPASVAYSTKQGIQHTYLTARHVLKEKVPGCFMECGVAHGASAGAMAIALNEAQENRIFHLFDSFEGIPLAGPKDADQPGIGAKRHDDSLPLEQRLVTSGVSAGPVEQVKQHMAQWRLAHISFQYHKGWFQHTLPGFNPGPIAMLRLDGDLYESTLCCLEHLYPFVSVGGAILIDDYPLPGCRAAVDEYVQAKGIKSYNPIVAVDTGAATWIKQ